MMDSTALEALLEEIALRSLSLCDDRMAIGVAIDIGEAVRYLNGFYNDDFCASKYKLIAKAIY